MARGVVKQYYSLAIGGEPSKYPDVKKRLKALRTPNFSAGDMVIQPERDTFHFSLVTPTSSRVDGCTLIADGGVSVDATVIWRTDNENYQRKDVVILRKVENSWLIQRIDLGMAPGRNY